MEEQAKAIIVNNILVGGFILIQAAIMYAFISMPKDVSDQLRHVKDHQRRQDDEKQKLMHRCRALEDRLAEIEKRLPEETEEESAMKK